MSNTDVAVPWPAVSSPLLTQPHPDSATIETVSATAAAPRRRRDALVGMGTDLASSSIRGRTGQLTRVYSAPEQPTGQPIPCSAARFTACGGAASGARRAAAGPGSVAF